MNRVKNALAASIILVALAAAYAAVSPAASRGQVASHQQPKEVAVVNTPSVNIANTPDVNIANMPRVGLALGTSVGIDPSENTVRSAPSLLVVGDGEAENLPHNVGSCHFLEPDLPAGLPFELTQAILSVSVPLSEKPRADLTLHVKGLDGSVELIVLPVVFDRTKWLGQATGILELSGAARIGTVAEAQPGEVFKVAFCVNGGSGSDSATGRVTVVGKR